MGIGVSAVVAAAVVADAEVILTWFTGGHSVDDGFDDGFVLSCLIMCLLFLMMFEK